MNETELQYYAGRIGRLEERQVELLEALKKLWQWNCTEKGFDPNCMCPACSVYKSTLMNSTYEPMD